MSEENKPKTGCVCPLSGFCHRHNVEKTPHLHKLCQNHQGYFDKWEACRGPGQQNVDCNKKAEPIVLKPLEEPVNPNRAEPLSLPSLTTQAKNLAGALYNHAKSGFSTADKELQQKRLDICAACPLLIKESHRCSACGCYVKSKVTMSSSSCPKGHW